MIELFSRFRKGFLRLALSKTARNTYMVFLGNILSAFFAFLFTVILGRSLSLSDFGYFSALLSYLLLVSDLSDIGIGSSLSAFIPHLEHDKKKLGTFLKTSFFLQGSVAISVTIILTLLAPFLSQLLFHTQKFTRLIYITNLGILSTILLNYFQYALSARQSFLKVSFLSSFGGFLRLFLLLVILGVFALTVESAVWTQTLMPIVLVGMGFIFIGFHFLWSDFSLKDLRSLLSFAKHLGVARGLTALASRLDVLMLIALTTATDAGIYSIASRVISIYPLLSGSFSTVIAPKLSAMTDKRHLKDFMVKVIIGTVGIIATIGILILIADPFITILFGQKAQPSVGVFRLLLVSMIFFVASIPPVSLAIYYLRKPHILSINSVIQLVIVFFGNMIFIPLYGRNGASYSLILAFGITLFFTSYLVYKDLQKKHA